MKKILISLVIVAFLFAAYMSKPDDKRCIIEVVKIVWGDRVPALDKPMYYEQFMDLTSKSVIIKDWLLFKQVKYKLNENKTPTVAIAVFNRIIRV